MTDQNMEARLRAAGERWRAANTLTTDRSDGPVIDVHLAPPPRNRHRWLTALSAAVVAAALVVGGFFAFRHDDGGATEATEASQLEGIEWQLAGSNVEVTFDATTMRIGTASCKPEQHRLQIDGNRMIIGRMQAPMLCTADPPGGSYVPLERATWGHTTWSLHNGRLTLSNPDVGSVVLIRPGAALIGPTWLFVSASNQGFGEWPLDTGSLHIGDDGRIDWTGECGSHSGNVALTATTIVITDSGQASNCGSEVVPSIAERLTGSLSYVLHGSQLTLTKPGKGDLVLTSAKSRTDNDPAQLSAHPWQLDGTEVTTTGLNSGGGSGHSAITMTRLTFDGHGGFTVQHRCYTNEGSAQLANGTATLTTVHLESALGCPSTAESAAGQHENDFVDTLLKGQVEWSIRVGELTITKGGTSATFSPVKSTGTSALTDSAWKVTAVAQGNQPAQPASANFKFSFTSGQVGAGCRSANAKVAAGEIAFSTGWAVPGGISCAAGFDSAVAHFLFQQLLVGTVTWTITSDQLTIRKPGVGSVVLIPA